MKAILTLALLALSAQSRSIRLPRQPQVSPDGKRVAFAWQNDVWIAPSQGGTARRLTTHPAADSSPFWSPDGLSIAFRSERSGSPQLFVVAADGGAPRQVTRGSDRCTLLRFTPGGKSLLVLQRSDRHFHSSRALRLYELDLAGKKPKRMLLAVGLSGAALSPDGRQILFTRGRASWSRKGYRGSMAMQLWLAELRGKQAKLRRLDHDRPHFQNVSHLAPMWAPDGKGCYYVSDPDGTFDIYSLSLEDGKTRRVTRVGACDRSDDGVAYPSISADGKTIVFRRRFDLYRLELASGAVARIPLVASGDDLADPLERRTESSARTVAFTNDGKQMAFVAGEDIWVMDRVLKEPVRVTDTPHREESLLFSADGKRLYFVSDSSGEVEIWEAICKRDDGIWWLGKDFPLRRVTDDRAVESKLTLSPTGKHIAYIKGTDLFVMDADGSDHRRVVEAWAPPAFDWSPDGKWIVYSTLDSDYNSDVYVVPLDGTRKPFNLSRHPDRDGSARWAPDGKRIAFVGRHDGDESDIYYVNLARSAEEESGRDRLMKKALEAMKKKPRGGPAPASGSRRGGARGFRGRRGRRRSEPARPQDGGAPEKEQKGPSKPKEPVKVTIDFDGIRERVHRIRIADSTESGLLWSPDGKKLAFNATVDGERGFYTVSFPEVERPAKLANSGLSSARWLASTNEIVGLAPARSASRSGLPPRRPVPPRFRGRSRRGFGRSGGVPAAMSTRGKTESFAFSIRRVKDWRALRQVAFDQAWRAMRDRFYDGNFNNRDWNAVRAKYRPAAAECLGASEFSELVNMMLGELNASHMGHRGGSDPLPGFSRENSWSPVTYKLGLRFADRGEGLRVTSVIPKSPCALARSLVRPGETLLAIDGQRVDRNSDLDALLTLDQVRDLELRVRDASGKERKVTVRPVASVSGLLYDEWVENSRKKVEELSDGKLGYLHIRGMNISSFRQLEEDLFDAGHGKEGLIIDVRFNGGGSTTDHVLTALTQPRHAITVSRGSGEGYPQDRKVYASWSKPIILMCNENSFSNAEILSHAIKQLGRGRLVGMRTAGGVISTGSVRLIDGSSVRMPTRGWYLVTTGEDMELNGCEPHIALWNPPGGPDRQLEAAVQALTEDVARFEEEGTARPVPASVKRRMAGTTGGGSGSRQR